MPPWSEIPSSARLLPPTARARGFRWACRMTWRPLSRKGPPVCGWARLFSDAGKSREAAGRVLLSLPPAHGGRLCGGPASNCATTAAVEVKRLRAAMWRSTTWATTACSGDVPARHRRTRSDNTAHAARTPHFFSDNLVRVSIWTSSSITMENGIALALDLWAGPAPPPTTVISAIPCFAVLPNVRRGGQPAARRRSGNTPRRAVRSPSACRTRLRVCATGSAWEWNPELSGFSATCGNPSGWSAVLEAFRELHRQLPRTALLIAGEFSSPPIWRGGLNRCCPRWSPGGPRVLAGGECGGANLRYPAPARVPIAVRDGDRQTRIPDRWAGSRPFRNRLRNSGRYCGTGLALAYDSAKNDSKGGWCHGLRGG